MALTSSIELPMTSRESGALAPPIADESRHMARHYMHREREGHTLQATALGSKAWIRLVDVAGVDWQDCAYVFAA